MKYEDFGEQVIKWLSISGRHYLQQNFVFGGTSAVNQKNFLLTSGDFPSSCTPPQFDWSQNQRQRKI